MSLVKQKHIEFEAYRVFKESQGTGRSAEEDWRVAEHNLSLFPSFEMPQMPGHTNAIGLGDNSFAVVTRLHRFPEPRLSCYGCRETFERYWMAGITTPHVPFGRESTLTETDRFFFSARRKYNEGNHAVVFRIANFVRYCESTLLDLNELTRFRHDNAGILEVKPSGFWNSCSMRFSLLTLLLRGGVSFNEHHPNMTECIIAATKISRPNVQTCNAAQRFFAGHTRFVGVHDFRGSGQCWLDLLECGDYAALLA